MITAQTIITVVILYLVIINVVGYVIMGVDKKEPSGVPGASRRLLFFSRRFWVAVWDVFLGMQHFRHKTKHWYFKYGMPAILVVQVLLLPFYSNRKYAILLLYEIKSGR